MGQASLRTRLFQVASDLIPDLAAHLASVDRAFQQVFYPGVCRALIDERFREASGESRPFRLGASIPLAAEPVVSGALLLLQLAQDRIPISDASAILRSPWLPGEADELSLRAIADIELRRRRELDVAHRDIEYVSRRCPRLAPMWRNLPRVVERKKSLDTFAGWSRLSESCSRRPVGQEIRNCPTLNRTLSKPGKMSSPSSAHSRSSRMR